MATPKNTAVAVVLYLLSVAAMTLSDWQIASYAPGFTKPELHFGYGYAEVLQVLGSLGEGGRQAYVISLVIDCVMPFMLLAATVLVVARAFPRWLLPLSVGPLAFLLLDLIENAAFLAMIAQFPAVAPGLVAATSPVTMIKLLSFAVTLPTLVVGVIVLALRGLRSRRVRLT